MKIGIISGTGPQGKGIALQWAKSGRKIAIGSRSETRAQEIVKELNNQLQSSNIIGMSNDEMIKNSDIILLTVPFEYAESTVQQHLELIKNYCKIFVDITIPMTHEKGKGMVPIPVPEGSSAQMLKKILDPVPVVAAFKTIGAHTLLDINRSIDRDTFVVGPQEERLKIIKLISEIQGLRPINAGPIREAQAIERLVPFLLNINRRYKVKDAGIVVKF